MGRNKALLPMQGMSLIERTVQALDEVSGRVILSTNSPNLINFSGWNAFPTFMSGKARWRDFMPRSSHPKAHGIWSLRATCPISMSVSFEDC